MVCRSLLGLWRDLNEAASAYKLAEKIVHEIYKTSLVGKEEETPS